MGDSREILKRAVRDLSSVLEGLQVSSLYVTSPQDFRSQPDFCNMAVSGIFTGTPRELLERIHDIEKAQGRTRTDGPKGGPRLLDIDIELFGDSIVRESDLTIPHERMNKRQFVLIPLLELESDCADPVNGGLYRDILAKLPDQGVRKVGDLYGN